MSTTATIVGNITRDPELRYSNAGKPVLNLSVAVTTRRKNGDQWEDGDPEYYDVTAFGTLAENAAESLEKGQRVVVVGRLNYSSWEKDGEKRSKVKVNADELGPSLRWVTVDVRRAERRKPEPKQESFDPGEEPF